MATSTSGPRLAQFRRTGAKDIAIRLLSEHCLADIATAVLPDHDVAIEEIRRTQLQLVERTADEVALARIDGRSVVLHVEYQTDDRADLCRRMLAHSPRPHLRKGPHLRELFTPNN